MLFSMSCELFTKENNQASLDDAIQKAVIETKAAATIQASIDQGQNNSSPTDAATEDNGGADAEPTNTDTPPTNTPEPTATAEPSATPTLTLTPTATIQPTPTTPVDDPTNTLGNPDYEDDFDNPSYWLQDDNADFVVKLQDNKLQYTKKADNNYSLWTASWKTIQDFYLEIVAQVPGACSGKDEWGMLFRTPEATKGHLFTITCDGYFRMRVWDGSDMDTIVNRTQSEHINTGSGAINRLGIMAIDEEIKIYVNGFFLATVNSNKFDMMGPYGITINAVDTADLTVHFSELRYWDLSD